MKCSLFDETSPPERVEEAYDAIFHETGLLKLNLDGGLAEVKEELIEYNAELGIPIAYSVVVECAQNSLADLFQTWGNALKAQQQREFFTPEKLALYFYQAMVCIQEMHLRGLYYGDMKAPNCLLNRNQGVRIGDMGICVKLDKLIGSEEEVYYIIGLTPGFTTEEVAQAYRDGTRVSRATLFESDKFALLETFRRAALRCKPLYERDDTPLYEEILQDLEQMSLGDAVLKWNARFISDTGILNALVD